MLNVMTFTRTGARVDVTGDGAVELAVSFPPQPSPPKKPRQSAADKARFRRAVTRPAEQMNCRIRRSPSGRRLAGVDWTMTESARPVPLSSERAGDQRAAPIEATVLICTFNRAELLAETLDTLAATQAGTLRWDVIVVDNNSNDGTREVVLSRAAGFPVNLRYVFEPRQGKSHALNAGMAATDAAIVVFTDDDVRVTEGWLAAACRPLLEDQEIDYTGGPVRPIWEQPCPSWIDQTRPDLWGTLAILDYGETPFVFEERRRVPLGANMAVRRALIERIGGFDPELGRRGTSLLGQEQAEFFCRSRAIGACGRYVPEMMLYHHVPARRLTRSYFRRWWFWKGVSRWRLEQRHPVTELGVDLSRVVRLAGIPRFMVGTAARDALGWVVALLSWDAISRMRHEMMLCYFLGYVRGAGGSGEAW
jgi:glucosyl-dolichyl phosphate glucuronosyltransferase